MTLLPQDGALAVLSAHRKEILSKGDVSSLSPQGYITRTKNAHPPTPNLERGISSGLTAYL